NSFRTGGGRDAARRFSPSAARRAAASAEDNPVSAARAGRGPSAMDGRIARWSGLRPLRDFAVRTERVSLPDGYQSDLPDDGVEGFVGPGEARKEPRGVLRR